MRRRSNEYNAIKLILNLRNKQHKNLIHDFASRQTVSRYINREYPIPEEVQSEWECKSCLNINKKYFIDDKGYCKILNDDEKLEIETMINDELFVDLKELFSTELNLEDRQEVLETNIRKLQKKISRNVYTTKENLDSIDAYLDAFEINVEFYNKLLELLKNSILSVDEWDALFKAMQKLNSQSDDDIILKEDSLANDIYQTIIKRRKEKSELERKCNEDLKKEYKEFVELFGEDFLK